MYKIIIKSKKQVFKVKHIRSTVKIIAKNKRGLPGVGIPTGGTTGQHYAKRSDADYDGEWVNAGSGSVSSVNGQTGAVVLDPDDLDDTSTTNKFATASELADIASNTSARHTHSNKALLDTYTQTETDLADAVAKKHTAVDISGKQDILSEGAFINGDKTKLDGIATGATANTGDVVGSGTSVENNIPRYTDTTGKEIEPSNVVIDEADDMSGINTLTSVTANSTYAYQNFAQISDAHVSSLKTNAIEELNTGSGVTIQGRNIETDGTKLDGIEANADVTDATNVDSAGATMNTDSTLAGNSYFLDEDTMASDSATKVPSQQSVKAYVDTAMSAVPEIVEGTGIDIQDIGGGAKSVAVDSTLLTTISDSAPKASPTFTGLVTSTDNMLVSNGRFTFDKFFSSPYFTVKNSSADTQPIISLAGSGYNNFAYTKSVVGLWLGAGSTTAPDVNLYRSAADTLKTDDKLIVGTAGTTTGSAVTIDGTQTLTNKTHTSPVLNTGVSGTAITDEDDMASNSDTKIPTQQSVKAYSDTKAPITSPVFTTNITTPLVVGGSSTTSDLSIQTTTGAGTTGADMHFLVGNNGATEAMTVLNSGNIGVGVVAPLAKLSVQGTGTTTGKAFATYNSSAVEKFYITDAGDISAGPSLTLGGTTGSVGILNFFNTAVKIARTGASGLEFSTGAGGGVKMTIDSSGNVGIGNTPAVKLDVTGEARVSTAGTDATSVVTVGGTQTMTSKTLTSPVLNTGVSGTAIDTDGTLSANSDTKLASQKAVKTYTDKKGVLAYDVFSSSGTWTKPSGAKVVEVYAIGGGGGGGKGTSGSEGTARYGGGGGGAGGLVFASIDATTLTGTVTVTVGTGGSGGTTDGGFNTGGNGTATTFGAYVSGGGGTGGSSGAMVLGYGTGGIAGASSYVSGSGGVSLAGVGALLSMPGVAGHMGSGAGGAGRTAANAYTIAVGGGNSSAGAGGAGGGTTVGTAGTAGTNGTGTNGGAGGGGGGPTAVGGAGGTNGGGGGGGGCAISPATSGNGGAGGAGYCIVVTYG